MSAPQGNSHAPQSLTPAEAGGEVAAPSLAQLFTIFARVGLTSFGGGVNGWMYRIFVRERQWLGEEEFLNCLAVSQAMPGINASNMAVWIGHRLRGPMGSIAGFCGIVVPPSIVIVMIGAFFDSIVGLEATHYALRGAAAAAVGLPLAMGISAARRVRRSPMPLAVMLVTFLAVGVLRLPLVWVVLVVGAISIAYEYRRSG